MVPLEAPLDATSATLSLVITPCCRSTERQSQCGSPWRAFWILPVFLFLVPAVILNVVSDSDAHSLVRTASYILLALFLICGALSILRAFSARANPT
jgi:hypothetical protein